MQSSIARNLDRIYAKRTGIGAEQFADAVCDGVRTRVLWNEDGQMVPDSNGTFTPIEERTMQYRAWTLPDLTHGDLVTVTFPPRTIRERPRAVQYVVRTVFPTNDGLEKIARVAPVLP